MVLARGDEVTPVESWDPLGMRGTGSHDGVVEGRRIPAERVFDYHEFFGARPEELPMLPLFACLNAAPALGLAERACVAFAQSVARFETPRDAATARLGRARATLDMARAALYAATAEMDDDPGTELDHAAWRMQAIVALESCRAAVDLLFDASGTRAQRRGAPIERAVRDLHTLSSHVAFDRDDASVALGRACLTS